MSETSKTKKNGKKGRRILKKIIIILVVLLILAGAAAYAYFSLKSKYTVTYTNYTATKGTISNSLSFSGTMSLLNSMSYYPTSPATVRTVYVSAGDEVKEGDKLIRLSNGDSLTADFDGRINKVEVEKDDDVETNTLLLQLADFKHMKVSVRVDEYDISDVAVGSHCTVTATATEQTFESEIAKIDYISGSSGNVAYYTAVVYVDLTGEEGIYPGMQATVTVPLEEATDVVVLKMDALSFDTDNSAYVMMMDENGELYRQDVEVGVSNGNYVEIKSGLNENDVVYVEVEIEEDAVSGLLSGLFGGNQFAGGMGGMGGGNMPDVGNFDPSNMPGSGSGERPSFDSGDRPSFGGGSSQGGGR